MVASESRKESIPNFEPERSSGDSTLAALAVEEAARRLNIGRTTMYDPISTGEVPSVKIGRLRRAQALSEYVASRLRPTLGEAVPAWAAGVNTSARGQPFPRVGYVSRQMRTAGDRRLVDHSRGIPAQKAMNVSAAMAGFCPARRFVGAENAFATGIQARSSDIRERMPTAGRDMRMAGRKQEKGSSRGAVAE
jgi:excisionase family DNA binding protein